MIVLHSRRVLRPLEQRVLAGVRPDRPLCFVAGLRGAIPGAGLATGEDTLLTGPRGHSSGEKARGGQDQHPEQMGTWPYRCKINISLFFFFLLNPLTTLCSTWLQPHFIDEELRFY